MAAKAKDTKPQEGFRASGAPDMRTEAEKSRNADDLVTVEPLKRTFRLAGKTYHPGETEVPKALASALGLIGKHELPASDVRREAPEFTGGPDVKQAQAMTQAQHRGAAGVK